MNPTKIRRIKIGDVNIATTGAGKIVFSSKTIPDVHYTVNLSGKSGAFDIHIGFDVFRLEDGDSIVFPASLPHRYVNPTDSISSALTVIVLDAEPGASDAPPIPVMRQLAERQS